MKCANNIYAFFIIQLFILHIGNAQNTVLRFGCFTYENGKYTVEVIYENNTGSSVAGFQFDLQNGAIDSAYGGSHQANGWLGNTNYNPNFTATSSRILSFSFGQPYIPPDTSVMIILRFIPTADSTEACLTNIVISDPSATAIPVIPGPCLLFNLPENFISSSDTLVCKGQTLSLGCSQCDSFPGTYHWSSLSSVDFSNEKSPTYNTNLGDTQFILNMINCYDTVYTDSINIKVLNPDISAIPGTEICEGAQVFIASTPTQHGEGFFWENDPLLNITSTYSANAVLNNDHIFYLSSANCFKIDSISFNVSECLENIVFIPSAFSPNYDNTNDLFYIRGQNIENINLSIYDRYGKEVFKSNSLNNPWDGTFNGFELSTDVYIYSVEVFFNDQTSELFYGNLTLIR